MNVKDMNIDADMKLKMIVGKAAAMRNEVGENCPQHILDRINKELHFVEVIGIAPLLLYAHYYLLDNNKERIYEMNGTFSKLYIAYLLGIVKKDPMEVEMVSE